MSNFDWSRFKNYGLWVAIFSLIPMILSAFGVNVVAEKYEPIVNTILGILVGLGILSNPTTSCKWFLDDKCNTNNDVNDVNDGK